MAAFLQTYMAQPGYPNETEQPSPSTINSTEQAVSADISPATADALPGVSGATAQTGGFAVAGNDPVHSFSNTAAEFANDSFSPNDRSIAASGPPSGFVPSFEGGGFGGGLASSPNVPNPGTSINPETGKPHTAGLTRAELEAIRAKGAGLLDPSPHTDVVRESSVVAGSSGSAETQPLSELSGREQAARQLTGTASAVGDGGEMTPGLELPGGWGHTKQMPLPGSGPNAPSSVYEDISVGLEKVGSVAFGLIPKGLKDALNPEAHVDNGKQPMGSPPESQPSSVNTLLENAKQQGAQMFDTAKSQGEKVFHDVQESFQAPRRESLKPTGRMSNTMGSEGSVFSQVKNFLAEAGHAAGEAPAKVTGVVGPITGPIAPQNPLPLNEVSNALDEEIYVADAPQDKSTTDSKSTEVVAQSLPSQENQGLRPGEVSMGVGALPGKSTEASGADLRDETATVRSDVGLTGTESPRTNTTDLDASSEPKMSSATAIAPITDTPAATETEESLLTEVDAAPSDSLSSATAVAPVTHTPAATETEKPLSAEVDSISARSESGIENGVANLGLAPPLPATFLGEGAARGATDLEATGLSVGSSGTATPSSEAAPSSEPVVDAHPVDTRGANERTTSSASIIAIHHGKEGNKPSPLAQSSIAEVPSYVSGATSFTPGNEVDGVGHPSTMTEESVREPGSYPTPDYNGPVTADKHISTNATAVDSAKTDSTEAEKAKLAATPSGANNTSATPVPSATHDSAIASSPTSVKTPLNQTHAAATSKDRRSGSNVSTGSNGKRKVGFMSKLKGEMKVISGKMSHDEEKIRAGERLKHGE